MGTQIFQSPWSGTQVYQNTGGMFTYNGKAFPIGVQSIDIRFGRTVNQRYSLISASGQQSGGASRFMQVGAGNGTLTLSTVFGPKSAVDQLLQVCSKVCDPIQFIYTSNTLCTTSKPQRVQIKGCVCNSWGYTTAVSQGIASVQMPMSFQISDVIWGA